MTQFVVDHKGEEVISERHQKDFKKEFQKSEAVNNFTDVDFDDI
jgi:hypothetical protein